MRTYESFLKILAFSLFFQDLYLLNLIACTPVPVFVIKKRQLRDTLEFRPLLALLQVSH